LLVNHSTNTKQSLVGMLLVALSPILIASKIGRQLSAAFPRGLVASRDLIGRARALFPESQATRVRALIWQESPNESGTPRSELQFTE
jgi:hypothetical protein